MDQEPPPTPAEDSAPPRPSPSLVEKSPEEKALDRARVAGDLRALIDFVCQTRFGSVPPALADLLPHEKSLALLSRWYIGAGSLSVEDLTALVRRPRSEEPPPEQDEPADAEPDEGLRGDS